MAKIGLYAVLDKAVVAFMPPFAARAHGEARRLFSHHLFGNGPSQIPPTDLDLYFVGEYDQSSGLFAVPEGHEGKLPLLITTGRQALADLNKVKSPASGPEALPAD